MNLKTHSHGWLEKTRNAHRVLVKKSLGKQLLEWMVDDIRLDNWEIGCDM